MSFERIYGKKKVGPRHATSQAGHMAVGPRHAVAGSLGRGRASKDRYTSRDLMAMSKPTTAPTRTAGKYAPVIYMGPKFVNPSEKSNRYGPAIGTWASRVRGANQVSSGTFPST